MREHSAHPDDATPEELGNDLEQAPAKATGHADARSAGPAGHSAASRDPAPESHALEALCVDVQTLALLLGLSVRHLRAMNSRGALLLPLSVGRRRLWRLDEVRDWVRAGMPPRERWSWPGEAQR